ncbi:porin [Chitinophaga pendula]|uniref:porin n=1 Tax=Chitinophaga TaxID=79328 RepID=UPI000BB0386B|nr:MULTISPECIES: porin [Chitinophaga]ASZ10222.1 hypothetical protein CK934_04120 [Chitinophaga sp. MD30]UCJ06819.1 porin [Chitinophaga pendula]
MKKILLVGATLCTFHAFAQGQTEQTEKPQPKLSVTGYVEAYYSYDFNQPENHVKEAFIYNHNRHNELNINLALLRANYTSDRVRANIGIMGGTYAQYNMAAESELFRHIYDANVGIRIGRQLWIDAGIMPSHIGFESAIGKDCYTLTRSIMADNTPYFETGAKITWTPNDKWTFAAMYLNGWQRVKRVDGNQTPAFGTQIVFKPSAKVSLNWSTFIGNDKPDSVRQMRYFNDLYGTFNITDKFSLIAGIDYGLEQKAKGSNDFYQWYSPIIIARYVFTDKVALAGRVEHYNDRNGAVIATKTNNGFQTTGYSLNLDIAPVSNVVFRIEGKLYDSKDAIFTKGKELRNGNANITAALAVSF